MRRPASTAEQHNRSVPGAHFGFARLNIANIPARMCSEMKAKDRNIAARKFLLRQMKTEYDRKRIECDRVLGREAELRAKNAQLRAALRARDASLAVTNTCARRRSSCVRPLQGLGFAACH